MSSPPPPRTVSRIRADRIVKNADGVAILRGCSLDLAGGGLTAVVGPSGAGKTSLLYCLSGLDRPDEGRVSINGTDLYSLGDEKRTRFLRQTAGFVFQQYNLIGYLTVEENVRLPHALARQPIDNSALEGIFDRFGLLEKRAARVSTLSGGEQQRAALCRAILMKPSVIFADEPTGALDTTNTGIVLQALREFATRDCAVIMVTHDIESATLADRIVFMRDGAIAHTAGRLGTGDILHLMARLGDEQHA